MENTYLKHLIESPLVYYVYKRGSTIYGTNTEESDLDFLVVVDSTYKVPKAFKRFKQVNRCDHLNYKVVLDNCEFIFYEIQDWFQHVLNCKIDAWECACLNKKYIFKEHVKLLMETNPLKLRLNFDQFEKDTFGRAWFHLCKDNYKMAKKWLWYVIKNAALTNQILINHKIVNFAEVAAEHDLLFNAENKVETLIPLYEELLKKYKNFLKQSTDGVKKQYYLNKYKEEHKDE